MPIQIDELIAEPEGQSRPRHYGKYRATCLNNVDPMQQGRIMVQVPSVTGEIPTGWAMPCAPVAGLMAGFFAVPPVGSGVWVEFEAGDVSRPIWVGGFWAVGELPGEPPSPGPPLFTQKIWRSDFGYALAMDDVLQTITITDPTGQNAVKVDTITGTVTISGIARVVLDAAMVQEGSPTAAHPAVKGDALMTYLTQLVTMFNAHMHPGELAGGFLPVTPAPPVPPFPPPDPSLISLKVFLE
jgi:hypothetical protein